MHEDTLALIRLVQIHVRNKVFISKYQQKAIYET